MPSRLNWMLCFVMIAVGCCDGHSKVLQGERGDGKASRVIWTHRVADVIDDGHVRVGVTAQGEVVVAASLRADVKVGRTLLRVGRGSGDDESLAASEDVGVWKLSASGKPIWGLRLGDARSQRVEALVVTGAGTAFVGGGFEGVLQWGENTWEVSDGDFGGFVGTLDPSGIPGWGTYFDAASVDLKHSKEGRPSFGATVRAVGTDDMGRLFVMGEYAGRFRIGGKQPIVDDPERVGGSFFARFDAGGVLRWYRLASFTEKKEKNTTLPGGKEEAPFTASLHDMSISKLGDVILIGTASGEGTFSGVPMRAGASSIFVSYWNQSGEHVWTSIFPFTGELWQPRVALGENEDIFLAGITQGSVTVGTNTVEAATEEAAANYGGGLFAARLEPGGKPAWAKRFATARRLSRVGLATDGQDGFVMSATVGPVEGLSDVGAGPLFHGELPNMLGAIFAGGYGADGSHRWSRGFVTGERNRSGDLAVMSTGRVVLGGALNIGDCSISCKTEELGDVFVVALGK